MQLDKLTEDYNNLKLLYKEKAKEAVKIDSFELFTKYPELQTIRWTQFIPHFNDGEPCEFGISEVIFSDVDSSFGINTLWYFEYDTEDAKIVELVNQGKKGELDYNVDFNKFNSNIMQTKPMWSDIFGDGVEVIITRSGIEIQKYEHD